MQPLSLTTPAMLFPAISLLMLAYGNRFNTLGQLVRKLHESYVNGNRNKNILLQIQNMRARLNIIKYMQGLGILAFILCVITMLFIYIGWVHSAYVTFAIGLVSLIISMLFSLREINMSTDAINIELSDMEEHIGESNIIKDVFRH